MNPRLAVRLGEHVISTDQDCDEDGICQEPVQDIEIERTIVHKQYDRRRKVNDIALLRLQTAADITRKNVKTICLPTTEESQIENIDKPARDSMLISGKILPSPLLSSNTAQTIFCPFHIRLGTN